MISRRRMIALAAAAVGAAIVVTVGVAALTADRREVCDGIGRTWGGCDPDQPFFAASDCRALGQEVGRQIDERVAAVLRDGPDPDESVAVRVFQAQGLVVGRANQFARREGLECSPAQILEEVENTVSDDFKAVIGTVLYDDGKEHTYDEWRIDMQMMLAVFEGD